LYTDGLTEAGKDPIKGEQRLAQLVGALDFSTVPKPARWLRHAFLDGKESHDDVALMVVRMVDDGHRVDVQSWDVTVTSGTAAQTVRSSLTANLRAHGVSESEAKKAEIVLGELIGNVVRHAGKTARIMLDWTSSAPVLHVMDDGPGFSHIAMLPKDPYSESGRGLFIVSELTLDFRVNKRPHGGSHARAVLDVGRRELTAPLLAPLSDRMAIL